MHHPYLVWHAIPTSFYIFNVFHLVVIVCLVPIESTEDWVTLHVMVIGTH